MFKFLLALVAISHLSTSAAMADRNDKMSKKNSLVCAILSAKDAKKSVSVKVDLSKAVLEEAYSSKSLDLGKDALSFDVSVEREGKKLSLNVFFYENNHVQDEIGGGSWEIDTAKAKAGKPVVTEPLELDDRHIANFVCYYNAK